MPDAGDTLSSGGSSLPCGACVARPRGSPTSPDFGDSRLVEPSPFPRGNTVNRFRRINPHPPKPPKLPYLRQEEQISRGTSALHEKQGPANGETRSDRNPNKNQMLHGTEDGPKDWLVPVQGVKIGHGRHISRSPPLHPISEIEGDPPLISLRSCRLVHGLSGPFRPPYSLPGHPRVHPMARPSPRRQDMCICSDNFCFQDFHLRCCLTPLETDEVSPPLPPSSDLPRLGRRCPVNQADKKLSPQYVVGGHRPSNSRVSELSVGTTGDWRSDMSVVISEAS